MNGVVLRNERNGYVLTHMWGKGGYIPTLNGICLSERRDLSELFLIQINSRNSMSHTWALRVKL